MTHNPLPVPTSVPVPSVESTPARSAWLDGFLEAGPVEVSVCIANWNCRELLRACLESLQDHPQGVRLETIVVDNASTDGAADMVARDFPEVVLVRNPDNLGFARASNQAARLARGRYLLFLNNDTVVPDDTLRRLVEYAEAHPDVGLIGPRLRDGQGNVQVSARPRPTVAALVQRTALFRWTRLLRSEYTHYRRSAFDPETERRVDVLMGAALFVPRNVFAEVGGWDESYLFGGEDIDLCRRVRARHPVVYLPRVEVRHFGRASTRQHVKYAAIHLPTGFARSLRREGCSAAGLFLYKLAVISSTPLEMMEKGLQYLLRRAGGRPADAAKSLGAFRLAWCFLRHGLVPFWRA